MTKWIVGIFTAMVSIALVYLNCRAIHGAYKETKPWLSRQWTKVRSSKAYASIGNTWHRMTDMNIVQGTKLRIVHTKDRACHLFDRAEDKNKSNVA